MKIYDLSFKVESGNGSPEMIRYELEKCYQNPLGMQKGEKRGH